MPYNVPNAISTLNIKNVGPSPISVLSGSKYLVMMNTETQLNSTVSDVAMPLMSDASISPIIIHGIGPYPKLNESKDAN